MALNKFMHPRNHYKHNRPDFAKLGEKYSDFKRFLTFSEKGKASLDFKNPEALKALTCTLLQEDFDINLDVPLDHIIPTVPLRLNYIHWLEDLVEGTPNIDNTWGIDIGCGTSCIYSLLGAKMNGWHFWALDVDPLALQYATDNVDRNRLGDQIKVIENTSDSLFLDLLKSPHYKQPKFHFTMCNPPFFGNILEAQGLMSSRSSDRSEPSSVSTADEGEMIVEGGEVEFVKKMISESCQVADRVLWFTSMLGKKSSVSQIVAELKREKVPTWTTTEFCQGRTMRWGVAWSYQRIAKKKHSPGKKKAKAKPPLAIPVPQAYIDKLFQALDPGYSDGKRNRGRQEKVLAVAMAMEEIMKNLKIAVTKQVSTKWNPKFELVANRNTWSHQRRKRRQSKSKKSQKQRLPQETESRLVQETSNLHAAVSGRQATREYSGHETEFNCPKPNEGENIDKREWLCGNADMLIQTAPAIDSCTALPEDTTDDHSFIKGSNTGLFGEQIVNTVEVPLLHPVASGCNAHTKRTGGILGEPDHLALHCQDNNNISAQNIILKNKDVEHTDNLYRTESEKRDLLRNRKERRITWKGEEDASQLLDGEPSVKQRKLRNSEAPLIQDRLDCNGSINCKEPQQYEASWFNEAGSESLPTVANPKLQNNLHNVILNIHDSNGVIDNCRVKDKYSVPREEDQPPQGSWGKPSAHVHSAICMSSSDLGSGSDADHGPLLKCHLEVKIVTKGVIEVVFSCDTGQSREVLHQVAQYLKNHITKEANG